MPAISGDAPTKPRGPSAHAEANQGSSNGHLRSSCCVREPVCASDKPDEAPRPPQPGRRVWGPSARGAGRAESGWEVPGGAGQGESGRCRGRWPRSTCAPHTLRQKCGAALTAINQPRNAAGQPGWGRAETHSAWTTPAVPRGLTSSLFHRWGKQTPERGRVAEGWPAPGILPPQAPGMRPAAGAGHGCVPGPPCCIVPAGADWWFQAPPHSPEPSGSILQGFVCRVLFATAPSNSTSALRHLCCLPSACHLPGPSGSMWPGTPGPPAQAPCPVTGEPRTESG